jgi:hypothetical protein
LKFGNISIIIIYLLYRYYFSLADPMDTVDKGRERYCLRLCCTAGYGPVPVGYGY